MAPTRMTLAGVLEGVRLRGVLARPLAEMKVGGLEYDSRRVEKDTLFFAFAGARVDGRQFARDAEARGACAVVSELPRSEGLSAPIGIPWIEVEHGRKALAIAARNFYAQPDERVHFTGITGTNGKTTTAYLTDAILRSAGAPTAMIGTIEYRIGDEIRKAPNTTPESLDVIRLAAELEQRGGRYLTMEVSSHGLALARVYGMHFHTAVFTNLTRDHLDFHHTMEEYAAAKRLLFAPEDGPAPRWAILNADDPASESMLPRGDAQAIWYGISEGASARRKYQLWLRRACASMSSIRGSVKPSNPPWWDESTCRTFWRRRALASATGWIWPPSPREFGCARRFRGASSGSTAGSLF